MQPETGGNCGKLAEQGSQSVQLYCRFVFAGWLGTACVITPNALAFLQRCAFAALRGSKVLFELFVARVGDFLRFVRSDAIKLEQVFEVAIADAGTRVDGAVEERLSERRFVGL